MSYIAAAPKVLAHAPRLLAWARGEQPGPVTLEWDLSNRCTLACDDCHFAHTHSRGPLALRDKPEWFESTGDLADVDLVRRVTQQAAQAGVRGVVWTGGGEPLTHPAWRECLVAAADAGLEQGLYTHGALVPDEPILSRLAWAVVSLDAADAASYRRYKRADRFAAACQGVEALCRQGVVTGVSFLLSEANWPDAPAMLAVGRSLGATYTTFRPLIVTWNNDPATPFSNRRWVDAALPVLTALATEPDVELSVARFVAWRDWDAGARDYDVCHGIKLNTTITPDGRMWLCPNRRGMTESCLGNLHEESFAAIWARHPGRWTDFRRCRAMCRLHQVNQAAAGFFAPEPVHGAFV